MNAEMTLTDEELAFLRYLCIVFPAAESPLRFLDDAQREPDDLEALFSALRERQLLAEDGISATPELLSRLLPVADCDARIRLSAHAGIDEERHDYYAWASQVVEYRRAHGTHRFGLAQSEGDLGRSLAARFKAKAEVAGKPLRMSSGDYLVFAVFARDVREAPEAASGDAMSIDEVLAYFDEPETKYVRTPSDEHWQQSVTALAGQGVLVKQGEGYELHSAYHALARQVVADHQHTLSRYDYLDEHWLVREVSLYPTQDSLYRIGTEPDGAVVIQELSAPELLRAISSVILTLPTLLPNEGSASKKTLLPAAR